MVAALAMPAGVAAQSAIDAYNLSQSELRGTARFMSMGGAFTALGGDLSTLNQNPAGIGIYRRSELGLTLDLSPERVTSRSIDNKISTDKTHFYCNNFGYVGASRLSGALRSLAWGLSYSRVASFNRAFDSYTRHAGTSLSNYIASYTTAAGIPAADMTFGDKYNPYLDGSADWLSILGYTSFMINPAASGGNAYTGLYTAGTDGDSYSQVRESGYVDEYAIDFGGNMVDVVYWGVGIGITDINYQNTSYYSESMRNAAIATQTGEDTYGSAIGNAGFELSNRRIINGSGWNLKTGVMVKPVQWLRLGFAVHTPTWYDLSQSATATVDYSYYNPDAAEGRFNPLRGQEYTDESYYDFKLRSPWKLMTGIAGVIGRTAIISADYERQAYGDMSLQVPDSWGNFVSDEYVNGDISTYFKATDIIRVGAEIRATPNLSLRAGYNFSTTNVTAEAADGKLEVLTAGMNPSYTFNKTSNSLCLGIGFHAGSFYMDGAYVSTRRNATYHAFTDYADVKAPQAALTQTLNNIVVSLGLKF